MSLKTERLEMLAHQLNLSKDALIEESLKVFLQRKLREVKTEIFRIAGKYKISSVEELEELYRKGQVEDKRLLAGFTRTGSSRIQKG